MKTQIGVWIDHEKAVVVTLTHDGDDEIGVILSKVQTQLRRTGDSPSRGSFEAQQVPADDRRQRVLTAHLNAFFDTVIACVAGAEALYILGPGEARGELRARLQKCKPDLEIIGFEAADKMSDGQIEAKVRTIFRQGLAQRQVI